MTDRLGLVVICVAGPVIRLDEFGCIDLLSSFSRALIPAVVWQKVQKYGSRALALPCLEFCVGLQKLGRRLETL
jgi:hypothetical protein